MISYPSRAVYEEVAFIAYYFHWSCDEIMNMPHAQRRRWVEEISQINQTVSGGSGTGRYL